MDFSIFWPMDVHSKVCCSAHGDLPNGPAKGFLEARSSKKDRLFPYLEHAHDSPRWSGGLKTPLGGAPPPLFFIRALCGFEEG